MCVLFIVFRQKLRRTFAICLCDYLRGMLKIEWILVSTFFLICQKELNVWLIDACFVLCISICCGEFNLVLCISRGVFSSPVFEWPFAFRKWVDWSVLMLTTFSVLSIILMSTLLCVCDVGGVGRNQSRMSIGEGSVIHTVSSSPLSGVGAITPPVRLLPIFIFNLF